VVNSVDLVAEHEVAQSDGAKEAVSDRVATRRVIWFAAAIAMLLLIRGFVFEPVRVRSDSMEPTLRSGSTLLIDRFSLHLRDPRRGEVVVASDPRTGEPIVKRVVAIGGDSVAIEDGVLIVNGAAVAEPSIDNENMEGYFFGPDVVPAEHVFVLGDHRSESSDSRLFGPIAVDDVDGRMVATIWPID
jgi:signal peptidase I